MIIDTKYKTKKELQEVINNLQDQISELNAELHDIIKEYRIYKKYKK